jgi:hypothetical protein
MRSRGTDPATPVRVFERREKILIHDRLRGHAFELDMRSKSGRSLSVTRGPEDHLALS